MKPIPFAGCDRTYGESQQEYQGLPAKHLGGQQGIVLCCWRLTWRERMAVLWRGIVWHQVMTFNHPLQPQLLSTSPPMVEPELPALPVCDVENLSRN